MHNQLHGDAGKKVVQKIVFETAKDCKAELVSFVF